jgi:SdrD B-like domain
MVDDYAASLCAGGCAYVDLTSSKPINLDLDFAYGVGSIGDTVFIDDNGNGVQDAGEVGVEGARITLPGYGFRITDASGKYMFDNLPLGRNYNLTISDIPEGTSVTSIAGSTVYLNYANSDLSITNINDLKQDFALGIKGSITGVVWYDNNKSKVIEYGEVQACGVTVNLKDKTGAVIATTKTTEDGYFNYDYDTGQQYFVPTGPCLYSFKNLPVNYTNGTDYTVEVVPLADFGINTFDPDGIATPLITKVSLNKDAPNVVGQNFGVTKTGTGLIGGVIWFDDNSSATNDGLEKGIDEVFVELLDKDGVVLQTTRTYQKSDGNGGFTNGHYDFSVPVLPGSSTDYSVRVVSNSNYTQTFDTDGLVTPYESKVTITEAKPENLVQDFGLKVKQFGAIYGQAFADTDKDNLYAYPETPMAGAVVELKDKTGKVIATTTTDSGGYYNFVNIELDYNNPTGFTVQVTPKTGYIAINDVDGLATVNTIKVILQSTVTNGTKLNQDFMYYAQAGIGDTIFFDEDQNGYQGPTELGIAGFKVTVTDEQGNIIGTAISDKNGKYFIEVPDPTSNIVYIVTVTPDAGISPTLDADDYDQSTDTITLTPNITRVNISAPSYYRVNLSQDFGYYKVLTPIVAVDDTKETGVNTPITFNPITNDELPTASYISKINGQTPIVGTPIIVNNGTVTLNADGTITVTPTIDSLLPIDFSYEVANPYGQTATANDIVTIVKLTDDKAETPINTAIIYDPIKGGTVGTNTANIVKDEVPTGSTITKINGITPVVGTPITVNNGTVILKADGTLEVKPLLDSILPITFPYEVTTPSGTVVKANDTVTIVKLVDDTKETGINTPVNYNPSANDSVPTGSKITSINGTPVTVGTPIVVSGGTVTLNADGTVTVTPDNNSTSDITFPYEVTTPLGSKVIATDTVIIVKAVDDTRETAVNTPITYDPILGVVSGTNGGAVGTGKDPVPTGSKITKIGTTVVVPGTPITVVVTGGTVTVNADGSVTVKPDTDSIVPIVFPYEVTTPSGTVVKATDTVTIVKAVDDKAEIPVNTAIVYDPIKGGAVGTNTANIIKDEVPTGSTITKINGITPVVGTPITVNNGTVILKADGTLEVKPLLDSILPITFPYEVTTPSGTVVKANDTVTIVKLVDDTKETGINTPVNYNPSANDSVPTGSKITSINGTPVTVGTPIVVSGGTVTLNADGTVTVTPDNNSTSDITFPYEVTTPLGSKVIATDTVIIVKAVDDTRETAVNTPITYDPILGVVSGTNGGAVGTGKDPVPTGSKITKIGTTVVVPGTPITVVVTGGTVTVNADGSVTVKPDTDSIVPIVFPYEVTTPSGTVVKATDTVTIVKAVDDKAEIPVNTAIVYDPIKGGAVGTNTANIIKDEVPTGSTITKINGITPVVGTPILVTNGTVTLKADGTLEVKPLLDSILPITFPYEVTTPAGTVVKANDIVTIVKAVDDTRETAVNLPITYDPIMGVLSGTNGGTVGTGKDPVPTGSKITMIDSKPVTVGTPIVVTGGTVILNADGTFTVTPDMDSIVAIVFPYEVTTPSGTVVKATDTVTIKVANLVKGSIGDFVFFDENNNGILDSTEKGIAAVVVDLYDINGVKILSTTTDSFGKYVFSDLLVGNNGTSYTVIVTNPLKNGVLMDSTFDFDGIITPNKSVVNLTISKPNRLDQDFGYYSSNVVVYPSINGRIGSTVWYDSNSNGLIDNQEKTITGIVVILKDKTGKTIDTKETDKDGKYEFIVSMSFDPLKGITSYDYFVEVQILGYKETFDADGIVTSNVSKVTLTENNFENLVQNFGYINPVVVVPAEPVIITTTTTSTPRTGGNLSYLIYLPILMLFAYLILFRKEKGVSAI